ncbi:hypothetical protein H5410_009687 [Solanum commersonii]|uniref:Uncharacterized protein n=1 Tax=Solanum commersonii TaxID=4109 RepID=A0A9J6AIL4_SOLCO|nr:hypothetical protein H5410_009687 [Solanum commersonii]
MMNMCPVLSTPIDWKETSASTCSIGLSKEDVDNGRVVKISGKWKAEEELVDENEKTKKLDVKWHRVEHNRGDFCRKFRLSHSIKAHQFHGKWSLSLKKKSKKIESD